MPGSKIAATSEMAEAEDVEEEGMMPVSGSELRDGSYRVKVRSSSSMFNVTDCMLTVKDGKMQAKLFMGGTGYLYVYPGTPKAAAAAPESEYIAFEKTEDGVHTFTVPVEALDKGFPCAAFSKKKEKWYERTLLVEAASLPAEGYKEGVLKSAAELALADGNYKVECKLAGGSGRASIESPAELTVKNGEYLAKIVWSSSNYDYMIVDGVRYECVNKEGNSTFMIPVSVVGRPMAVQADTLAMGKPHLIDYTITFDIP